MTATMKETIRDTLVSLTGLTLSELAQQFSVYLQLLISAATLVFIVSRIVHTFQLIRNEKNKASATSENRHSN